ncbi:MAG: hypothetical protein ACXVC6_15515 [Bacteroidia bacterium]
MATATHNLAKEISINKGSWLQRFMAEAKYNYFAVIAMAILVISIWGGITAMVIQQAGGPVWALCINIYITMASNIASIGQAPVKWVVGLFTTAVLVNLLLILAFVL